MRIRKKNRPCLRSRKKIRKSKKRDNALSGFEDHSFISHKKNVMLCRLPNLYYEPILTSSNTDYNYWSHDMKELQYLLEDNVDKIICPTNDLRKGSLTEKKFSAYSFGNLNPNEEDPSVENEENDDE